MTPSTAGRSGGAGPVDDGPVRLVLATHNAHKVAELRRILGPGLQGIELVGFTGPDPVEDGETFEANALIKARAAAEHTGLPAIADDSGICVDALGGAPGIRSARYAGTRDDGDNLRLLLHVLTGVEDRAAHFACAAALVVPAGYRPPPSPVLDEPRPRASRTVFETALLARWQGAIAERASGEGGFGYDPVFLPADADLAPGTTAAELDQAEKDARSHRALAFGALLPVVRERLLGERP